MAAVPRRVVLPVSVDFRIQPWQRDLLARYFPEEKTMPTPPTYLNLEQAARSAALEKARAVLENRTAFSGSMASADPGDIVALARFILSGEDLYEAEETTALTIAPGAMLLDEATWDTAVQPELTSGDIVKGRSYVVLPGARSEGFSYADAEDGEHHPVQGTIVKAVDDGVDSDGDAYVTTESGEGFWVLPEYLIPAV